MLSLGKKTTRMIWGVPVMVNTTPVLAKVARERRQGRELATVWCLQRSTTTYAREDEYGGVVHGRSRDEEPGKEVSGSLALAAGRVQLHET